MDDEPALSGWGRTFLPGREVRSEDLATITQGAHLSRGLGRSYGDASLPPSADRKVVGTVLADRILGFDEATGVLRAESGLCLAELNRLYLPRGFFTPVTPGTKFVTLGGMVAADVHGKNHHVTGTFGRHVRSLCLRVADGRVIECSRERERELFLATLGGMGLTGHILEVEVALERVPSPWIYQEVFRFHDLDAFLAGLKQASAEWPFTVGWIDCLKSGSGLGRGILYCGRWATKEEAPAHFPKPKRRFRMPFSVPSGLLNRFTVGVFNHLVFHGRMRDHSRGLVDPDTFFYPLDRVEHWNLVYGSRGVTQHQCVVPESAGTAGVRRVIELLAELGAASFLSVIKDCGAEGEGMLSFPRPGMSIALDLPIRDDTQQLVNKLNAHVIQEGGRVYLAKDGLTRPEDFRAMDPRITEFARVRNQWDPEHRIESAQSERLFGAGKVQPEPQAAQVEGLPEGAR